MIIKMEIRSAVKAENILAKINSKNNIKYNWREDFSKEIAGELADIINITSIIATDNNIDLEQAFKNKLNKTKQRFEV
ncbi:MAG: hypothetical protein ACP5D2_00230 [Candidatus Nanoarchaeia archaeon]